MKSLMLNKAAFNRGILILIALYFILCSSCPAWSQNSMEVIETYGEIQWTQVIPELAVLEKEESVTLKALLGFGYLSQASIAEILKFREQGVNILEAKADEIANLATQAELGILKADPQLLRKFDNLIRSKEYHKWMPLKPNTYIEVGEHDLFQGTGYAVLRDESKRDWVIKPAGGIFTLQTLIRENKNIEKNDVNKKERPARTISQSKDSTEMQQEIVQENLKSDSPMVKSDEKTETMEELTEMTKNIFLTAKTKTIILISDFKTYFKEYTAAFNFTISDLHFFYIKHKKVIQNSLIILFVMFVLILSRKRQIRRLIPKGHALFLQDEIKITKDTYPYIITKNPKGQLHLLLRLPRQGRHVSDTEKMLLAMIRLVIEQKMTDIKLSNIAYLYSTPYPNSDKILEVDLFGVLKPASTEKEIKQDVSKNKKIQNPKEILRTALKDLNDMIGLNSVKEKIEEIRINKEVEQRRDTDDPIPPGHYIFKGNPGTGKTTVAKVFANILQGLGVLSSGHLVEATRKDLVAEYSGQTAQKTQKVLEDSLGGILFIDEAYSLINHKEDSFGKEAVTIILDFMEKNRQNFTLIIAGYDKNIDDFIDSNAGLNDRFTDTIYFEDYSPIELVEIYTLFATKKSCNLGEGVKEKLLEIFDELKDKKHFGNGRVARKVFVKNFTKLNRRVYHQDLKRNDIRFNRIEPEDIDTNISAYD